MLQRAPSETAGAIVLTSFALLHTSTAGAFPANCEERSWYAPPEPHKVAPSSVNAVHADKQLEPDCTREVRLAARGETCNEARSPRQLALHTRAKTCQEFIAENFGKRMGEFGAGIYFLREKTIGPPRLLSDGITWRQQGLFEVSALGTSITMPEREIVPWSPSPSAAERSAWTDFWDRLLAHERGHEAIFNDWLGQQVQVAGYGNDPSAANRAFKENHKRAQRVLAETIDLEVDAYHLVAGEAVQLDCPVNG